MGTEQKEKMSNKKTRSNEHMRVKNKEGLKN